MVALTGKGVTTPTPWDWPVELSGPKKQNRPDLAPVTWRIGELAPW